MKEKPILFNSFMVRAILNGKKTMTRRIVEKKLQLNGIPYFIKDEAGNIISCKYQIGNILWVRETFNGGVDGIPIAYRASNPELNGAPWKSSIFMPKKHCRIFLEITGVRVERLNDITESEALDEGVPEDDELPMDEIFCANCKGQGVVHDVGENFGVIEVDCPECDTAKKRFKNLWNSINKKRGHEWNENPFCWVIFFKRINNKG